MAKERSSSFNLKSPKSDRETMIYFSTYFKNEQRKFVYSTGEKIHPEDWDFHRCEPKYIRGTSEKAIKLKEIGNVIKRYSTFFQEVINRYKIINEEVDIETMRAEINEIGNVIKRYSTFFQEVVSRYKIIGEEVDIETIRGEFNAKFKKSKAKTDGFFGVYDLFLDAKRKDKTSQANAESTISRYVYFRKLLQEYETFTNTKLHLNRVNKSFYNSFLEFCVEEKVHYNNTLRRNVGLLKTFLNWALENRYTYKSDFKNFKSPKGYVTDEIALTYNQVQKVYNFDFSNDIKLERVRDLFVFGCATGMRFSNYSTVNKQDIQDESIYVVDVKDKSKILNIPLNNLSSEILKKYKYVLPNISSQRFNDYIKIVFKKSGFTANTKKISRIGNEVKENFTPIYNRVSSHTARRSFITIMKNKGVPDKVIMDITGHKSIEVFNKYYKPNNTEKRDFMNNVWQLNQVND